LSVIACVGLFGGCARGPAIGVTSIRATTLTELQGYLLDHDPDVDQFRLRGPFSVTEQKDREIRLSPTERLSADLYLSASRAKAPLVIFLHGYDNSKEDHGYQAMHVATWGMHGLALQLPNHGPWRANGRTLARLVDAVRRAPEAIDGRIDGNNIILVGHSFGGTAVAVALGEGAPVAGAVLLDAAGIGRDLPASLKRIKVPVMLVAADEELNHTRNREFFYDYIPRGVAEVSIKDANHEDAQFRLEVAGNPSASDPVAADEAQVTFVSALTASAFSLAATGKLDYAWASFEGALKNGKLVDPKRK
jgi:pimeloyl-ACP methyl ester carboxylesterase